VARVSYAKRKVLEETAAIQAELIARQENDPLTMFELFTPQREFAADILSRRYKEYYYIGANRSGKSDAGAYAGAHLARFGYDYVPGREGSDMSSKVRATSGWVSAIDFPTGRDTIQPKYFDNGFTPPGATHEPFIPAREILDWRISDQVLKLKNGSIIGFKSADSGRTKYQGAEKDWIHFDEEHPEGIYEEAIIRVGANPLHIFTTCTLLPPEGQIGGVTWIYNKIVKKWKLGTLEDAQIYNASIYDNPHIPVKEIEFLETKFPQGSAQRMIRLEGQLIGGIGGARIYSSFDTQLNVYEQRDINMKRPLCWTWDFNVEPMVSLIGTRERGLFRVHRELILEEANIAEMCDLFKRTHPHHRAEIWLYGDASGSARTAQTKMSSYQIILNEMKDYPAPIRLKIPEKNPGVTDRINSVNVACKGIDGIINLEVDPSCSELIDDLEQVVGDGKQGIKKTFNKKDPYYRRTHMTDALGYWIYQEAPIVSYSPEDRGVKRLNIKRPQYSRPRSAPGLKVKA
jgi:phage terminase large subunit-like protein